MLLGEEALCPVACVCACVVEIVFACVCTCGGGKDRKMVGEFVAEKVGEGEVLPGASGGVFEVFGVKQIAKRLFPVALGQGALDQSDRGTCDLFA